MSCLAHGQSGVDGDVGLGAQGVSDPSDLYVPDLGYAFDGRDGGCGLVDDAGVHGVHQSGADLADRGAEHPEDRDGDQQSDDEVGPVPADGEAAGAEAKSVEIPLMKIAERRNGASWEGPVADGW